MIEWLMFDLLIVYKINFFSIKKKLSVLNYPNELQFWSLIRQWNNTTDINNSAANRYIVVSSERKQNEGNRFEQGHSFDRVV